MLVSGYLRVSSRAIDVRSVRFDVDKYRQRLSLYTEGLTVGVYDGFSGFFVKS